jgi:hypothetical protein
MMAQTVSILLSVDDRARLVAIVGDRNRPHKHVLRARIILLSADRLPVLSVAERAGVSRPAVWRWQQRFAEEEPAGLLRDKTRPPGTPATPAETVARVVTLTCSEPPYEATHWTGRAMAKATGLSLSTVQRIWAVHKLQPHRLRTFKRSRDPDFEAKLTDIVGDQLPTLRLDARLAGANLILDRGFALKIGGVPGIDDSTHGDQFSSVGGAFLPVLRASVRRNSRIPA